jgi:hypothetical protein
VVIENYNENAYHISKSSTANVSRNMLKLLRSDDGVSSFFFIIIVNSSKNKKKSQDICKFFVIIFVCINLKIFNLPQVFFFFFIIIYLDFHCKEQSIIMFVELVDHKRIVKIE